MPPRTYTDLHLACAVAESKNMREVLTKLNLAPRGGNSESVWNRIRSLGLPSDHFTRHHRNSSPVYAVPDDVLRQLVASNPSKAAVLRALGLDYTSPNIRALKRVIETLRLDVSHHLGAGWRKGSKKPVRPATPLAELLVRGRPCPTKNLKRRLLAEGVKEHRCENCRATRWFGKPLAIELHHVNGDRQDNRLENLQLLCPNCHSLTDTYRGRNIGRMVTPP